MCDVCSLPLEKEELPVRYAPPPRVTPHPSDCHAPPASNCGSLPVAVIRCHGRKRPAIHGGDRRCGQTLRARAGTRCARPAVERFRAGSSSAWGMLNSCSIGPHGHGPRGPRALTHTHAHTQRVCSPPLCARACDRSVNDGIGLLTASVCMTCARAEMRSSFRSSARAPLHGVTNCLQLLDSCLKLSATSRVINVCPPPSTFSPPANRHQQHTRNTHDTTRHDTTRHDTTRHDTTRMLMHPCAGMPTVAEALPHCSARPRSRRTSSPPTTPARAGAPGPGRQALVGRREMGVAPPTRPPPPDDTLQAPKYVQRTHAHAPPHTHTRHRTPHTVVRFSDSVRVSAATLNQRLLDPNPGLSARFGAVGAATVAVLHLSRTNANKQL
jgi:hypothetical protein